MENNLQKKRNHNVAPMLWF